MGGYERQDKRAQSGRARDAETFERPTPASPYPPLLGLQRAVGNRQTIALLRTESPDLNSPEAVEEEPRPDDSVGIGKLVEEVATSEVVGRMITAHKSDPQSTHAGVVKTELGVPANAQGFPTTQGLKAVDRAAWVKALVDKDGIRQKEREKSSVLSDITELARAEEYLLQGADLKKFYDAGHLIGDQLVGEKDDTFVPWNLAPQVSEFNTPRYSAIENQISVFASKPGQWVDMTVALTYPADYQISVSQLKKRGVIPQSVTKKPDTYKLSFPRRIPESWIMEATFSQTHPSTVSAPLSAPLKTPYLGTPYDLKIDEYTTAVLGPMGFGMTYNHWTRRLEARQWAPSEDIRAEDILSYILVTYPDLLNKSQINVLLRVEDADQVGIFKAATQGILRTLLDLSQAVAQLKDATQAQELLQAMSQRITIKVDEATAPQSKLTEAAAALVTAKAWVTDLQDQLAELKKEQDEKFPFNYTTAKMLEEHAQSGTVRFEQTVEQMQPDYEPETPEEAMSIEARQGYGDIKDVRDLVSVSAVVETHDNGGTLTWSEFGFGSPVEFGQKLLVKIRQGKGQFLDVVVKVTNAQQIGSGGQWLVSWAY